MAARVFYVYFQQFDVSRLDGASRDQIQRIIVREFSRIIEICDDYTVIFSTQRLYMCSNGQEQLVDSDIIIAYGGPLPSIANPAQKNKELSIAIGQSLIPVIPTSLSYGGKVLVNYDDQLRDAPPSAQSSIPFAAPPGAISSAAFSAASSATPAPSALAGRPGEGGDRQDEYAKLSMQYQGEPPKFTFDQLVLQDEVRRNLLEAIAVLKNRELLFSKWNLKTIMSPSVLLNLYGDSGTGKTMTAEAIASLLGKQIIRASYADIESKYHGEGPKRLMAIFMAAQRDDAVLFIDEADSLLSARLTNVSQGSEQAINSMRSQLLICLENFDGVAIFATNLIRNYDKAFLTRLMCVQLRRPDFEARKQIWHNHLYPVGEDKERQLRIPLEDDINLDELASFDFCGRDIRNAVKKACISVVVDGREIVGQQDLMRAGNDICRSLEDLHIIQVQHEAATAVPSTPKQQCEDADKLVAALAKS